MRIQQAGVALIALGLGVNVGCSNTSHLAALSNGDLAGKRIVAASGGEALEGTDCGFQHHLSNAFRDALDGSRYDTLTNVEVTTTTGLFVWSNCVKVKGLGVRSSDLSRAEDKP